MVRHTKKAPDSGAFFIVRGMAAISILVTLLAVTACAAEPAVVVVKKVLDGDTVVLQSGEKVRMIGLNAPEKEFDDRPAQALSLEATLLLRELVEGKTAHLTVGQEKKDKYDRTLGYLDLPDGTDVQEQLIRRGYAFVVAFPPNIGRLATYVKSEKTAQASGVGIWRDRSYRPLEASGKNKLPGGFHLVTGKITKIRNSKKNVRLLLGESLVIGIRHGQWENYWDSDAGQLKGKTVIARGWISRGKKGKPAYLRVRHPSMLAVQ